MPDLYRTASSLNIRTVKYLASVDEPGIDRRWMSFEDAGGRQLDADDPMHHRLLAN
jgi:hypothetical protein